MNWPRYVNPEGMFDSAPPAPVIAAASAFRVASSSWLSLPPGTMREKRNVASGGEPAFASALAAVRRLFWSSARTPSPTM